MYMSDSRHFLHDRKYDRTGVRMEEPNSTQPGLTLLTSHWKEEGDWQMKAKLIDRKGETVHEWTLNATELFADAGRKEPSLHGTYLYPDGDLLANIEYGGTVRLDACGEVRWKLPARSHHSIDRAGDGTFWIPGLAPERREGSEKYPEGYPGLDLVWIDQVMNVSEDGEVLEKVNILDLLYANDLQHFLVKAGQYRDDVTHLNDVEPLLPTMAEEYPLFETGDLLVSLRNIDLVFVFDPESKNVKWHASAPLHMQHDPDFTGDGWIGIFNNNADFNGGDVSGGTQIVALQSHTDSTEVRFPTPDSGPFYTPFGGKWQKLDNGNMLLTEAHAGRVVEVGPDGRTVWEWVKGGGAEVTEVLEGTRQDLTRKEVASWPCSSVESVATSSKNQ